MPTAGDFSLHVIGQAQGFEQMSSQVNQFAGTLDTAGASATRFASSAGSLSTGFSSIATGTNQMTAGFSAGADALSQFGQSTTNFSSQINTMGTSFNSAGQSITQFGGSLEQGEAGIGQFTTGVEQMNQAVGQSTGPLDQLGQGVQTLEADLSGVGQEVAGVDQNLNGLASGGLTKANTMAGEVGQTFEMNTGIFKDFDNQQKSTFETMQSGFGDVQKLASGFAQASGSITGLIFSAYSLEKAQLTVHKTETALEAARLKLDKMTTKLSETEKKYGEDSIQVAQAQEAIALQTQRNADLMERAGLVSQNYSHQLLAFATTTGPLVVSTVSGIAQGITSMAEVIGPKASAAVSQFVQAWGPAIAIGGIAATIAVAVVSMYADMAQADADYKAAILRNDTAGALKAQFDKVSDVINAPLSQLGYLTPAGAAHKKEDIAGLEKQYGSEGIMTRTKLSNQLEEFVSGEFFGDVENVSPEVRTKINNLVANMKKMISTELRKVNFGLDEETPEQMAARGANTEKVFNTQEGQIRDLITKGMAAREAIMTSGSAEQRAAMMGGFSEPEMAAGRKLYGQNLAQQEALLLQYDLRRAGGATETWEEFVAITKQGNKTISDEEYAGAGEMLKIREAANKQAKDDKTKAIEEQDKLNEKNLKDMMAWELAGVKVKHDAIEKKNKENEEQLKSDLAFAKQQAEIQGQNVAAWKQRTGMITEEQKLVADMTHERQMGANFLTKQYQQEAMQLTGLNNLNGLRIDQVAELALTQEKHTKIIRDANVELMHMADAAGIDASAWIQFKAAGDANIDTVQELNDQMEILINTSTNYLQMVLDPTQEQLNAVNMAYTKGVVSLKASVEQQFLAQHQALGYDDALTQLIKKHQLFDGSLAKGKINLALTHDQMELLKNDFVETGNTAQSTSAILSATFADANKAFEGAFNVDKIKKVDDELKKIPGFKDFPKEVKKAFEGASEEQNKLIKKTTEFGGDINIVMQGIEQSFSGKLLKQSFGELTSDLNGLVKNLPEKEQLDPMLTWLQGLTGTQIRQYLPMIAPALKDLNAAIAQPEGIRDKAIQAVIAKYPEIFKMMGVNADTATGGIDSLNDSFGGLTKTLEGFAKSELNSGKASPLTNLWLGETAKGIFGGDKKDGKDGKDEKKGPDDFGVKALQAAEKEQVKFAASLQKYVVQALIVAGNKSAEFDEVVTANFEDLNKGTAKFLNQFVKNVSQTMVKAMIVAGDTSARLDEVVTANFEDINKGTAKMMNQFVKNIMQTMYNSMTKTGDWSARLDEVMTANFQDINKSVSKEESKFAQTMGKIVSSMQKAEAEAKALASTISKFKDKDFTVTTHYKTTGTPPSGGSKPGNHSSGGIFWASQATQATYGEAGDELALFLPIRRMGETRRGDFDITIPQPTPDLSGIQRSLSSIVGPKSPKELVGDAAAGAQKAITIVLNMADKVMLNEHELIDIIRRKVFKHIINEMG